MICDAGSGLRKVPVGGRRAPPAGREDRAPVDRFSPGEVVLPEGGARPYPKAPRTARVERVHGVHLPDPYRPLEHMGSIPTRAWVTAQNRLTRAYLAEIPERAEFKGALEAMEPELRRLEDVVGNRVFYTRRVGEEQPVLFEASVGGRHERVLLDPNLLSRDGHIALDEWKVSPDGQKLVYGVRRKGSDWLEWRVRDLARGEDLPDRVRLGRYGADSLTWDQESKGFFYQRYHRPQKGRELTQKVRYDGSYFHRLGTAQSQDRPEGAEGLPPSTWNVRTQGDTTWTRVAQDQRCTYYLVKGPRFPTGAVLARDTKNKKTRVVVKGGKDVLDGVTCAHGQLFAQYLHDAHARVVRFDMQGKRLGEVGLPGMGTVSGFLEAPRGRVLFEYSSPTHPNTVYSLNVETGKVHPVWKPEVRFDPQDYETRLAFCTSRDGTRIPLYITHRKDTPMDGQRPTYLYAYGGFGSNETPLFDWSHIPWLNKGGVYVQAVLRGGGEYGEEWHRAGMRLHKQRVFDDFIAAGEWLVKEGITSPDHLGIGGASNGGLLVAATELQRPDLFGAAVPEVGVMDMVRFPRYTGGGYWTQEYGEISKPRLRKKMLAYSPVHNVEDGHAYPATLVMTGDHDDRVVPAHSYKFAAQLQQSQGGGQPVLLRTERDVGHGFGRPRSKQIEQNADLWAFLWNEIGLPGTVYRAATKTPTRPG